LERVYTHYLPRVTLSNCGDPLTLALLTRLWSPTAGVKIRSNEQSAAKGVGHENSHDGRAPEAQRLDGSGPSFMLHTAEGLR
jgi:hypothetical protein